MNEIFPNIFCHKIRFKSFRSPNFMCPRVKLLLCYFTRYFTIRDSSYVFYICCIVNNFSFGYVWRSVILCYVSNFLTSSRCTHLFIPFCRYRMETLFRVYYPFSSEWKVKYIKDMVDLKKNTRSFKYISFSISFLWVYKTTHTHYFGIY